MKKNNGFTLVELLAVMVILGILLAVSTVAVVNIKNKQDKKNRENIISSILTGAKRYVADNPSVLSNKEVEVKDLLNNNYVDFDKEKYSDLLTDVKIVPCGDSLKLKYSIKGEDKTYNDCGCEEQSSGSTNTICTEKEESN